MKIHFLGSGASEGIPNPFCRCDLCRRVRQIKGKDVRTHSSVIIDDVLLIDIAPTFSHQILRDGVDACAITDLLFTHTHPDHFNVAELTNRMEGFGHGQQHPLNIYGNDMAISGCVETFNGYRGSRFQLHCLAPFVTVDCGAFQVTPLLANHAKWELCYVWYIEKGARRCFTDMIPAGIRSRPGAGWKTGSLIPPCWSVPTGQRRRAGAIII
jgi:phosphoribosyl 1,2-cyclic phosphate phosphodiesterase